VKVDKLVVVVSKRMQIVVGFALSLVGDRCSAIQKALDAEWGPAMDIGGKNHEVEWEGKRVDAIERSDLHQSAGAPSDAMLLRCCVRSLPERSVAGRLNRLHVECRVVCMDLARGRL
jgi:hypothetical protein